MLGGGGVSVMLHMHDDCIDLICFSEKTRQKQKGVPLLYVVQFCDRKNTATTFKDKFE
jgi:hypothetical protein